MGIQVSELTSGKACHEKEFIDFEFDGKHISEFGMVAVFNGDRHSFSSTPSFEDETSTVNGMEGQYYWGTKINEKRMSFSLATDGMTEAEVNAFKLHFKPGKYGKFIEDKLAHRYGYCRITNASNFSVIPFQKTVTIRGENIKINEYKGEATLEFIFDDPYFYSTENCFEELNDEALRASYNNGTPFNDSWDKTSICFIGESTDGTFEGLKNGEKQEYSNNTNNPTIFYNPSTAAAKPKISLTFSPKFSATSLTSTILPIYFNEIADDINATKEPYHTIKTSRAIPINSTPVNADYINSFRYSSPDVIYSINKTIKLVHDFYVVNPTGAALELEEKLRLEVVNFKVMAWAAAVLRQVQRYEEFIFYDRVTGRFTDQACNKVVFLDGLAHNINWFQYFNLLMLCMLGNCTNLSAYPDLDSWSFDEVTYTIVFDSEQSKTTMDYSYNQIINSLEKIAVKEENCGEMVYSSYLKLDGGDTLDLASGKIQTCHYLKVSHGASLIEPKNLSIAYKYTYL